MTARRWFKFYPEWLYDIRTLTLSDKDFRLWTKLLCVAAKNDGHINPD